MNSTDNMGRSHADSSKALELLGGLKGSAHDGLCRNGFADTLGPAWGGIQQCETRRICFVPYHHVLCHVKLLLICSN